MSPAGIVLQALRDPVGAVERAARGGDPLVRLSGWPAPFFLVTTPDAAREVLEERTDVLLKGAGSGRLRSVAGSGLMFSEGELNARRRAQVEPLLSPERVARFAPDVVAVAETAAGRLVEGSPVELVAWMRALTTEALLRSLMADLPREQSAALGGAVNRFAAGLWHALVPGRRLLERVGVPGFRDFAEARHDVERRVRDGVRARVGGRGPGDLLDDLIDARDGHGSLGEAGARDEMMSLLLAGRGTIAAAVAWTWWLLARHPDVEAAVHAEVDAVLDGRPPRAEDLPALATTRAAFEESLRLYSPAWVLRRKAVGDTRVAGEPVREGATVLVSSYLIQRDRRVHPDPLAFDPARFRPEGEARRPRHPYAYFPFGGGPRACPGYAFASQEAVLVLATVARRWRFLEPAGAAAPRFARGITLRPKEGLPMVPERRPG